MKNNIRNIFIKSSIEIWNTVSNWKNPNSTSLWRRLNTWGSLSAKMLEGQTQNGLPQPKTCQFPKNVSALQSFLGLANYYHLFKPNMLNLRAPLNELLKKYKDWEWTPECQEAFVKIKEVLTLDLFLIHYNPDLDIIVASDASSYGIGACILFKMPDRSHKPVAYASRTLFPAENNSPK